jgi:uncharacterized protein YbaP (TraB family)
MRMGRLPAVMLTLALSGVLWAGDSALAGRNKAAPCRGIDLIARLSKTDPIGYRRIVTRAAEVENSGAMFWLVEKDGLEPSYLLGTVHVTDDRVKRLPVSAEMALQRADRVAVETYFEDEENIETVLSGMGPAAVTSVSDRLSNHLNAQELGRLQRLAQAARMKSDELDRLNPWVAEMLIRGQSCEGRRLEEGVPVLDAWIAGRATRRGIGLEKLETVTEQFAALAEMPYAGQIAMLRYALAERPTSNDDEMETMIGLYLRRQIPAADALTRMLAPNGKVASTYLAAFWNDLIQRRNVRFVESARPLIEKGRVFIVVGAAHLPGENGVVELLRKAGYRLTPADDGASGALGLAAVEVLAGGPEKPSTKGRRPKRAAKSGGTGFKLERTTARR